MMLTQQQLHGMTYKDALCMGVSNLGAHYCGDGVRQCCRDPQAVCAICGRPATNVHHEPPVGMGGGNSQWTLELPDGRTVKLRPALIALCGSGTEGCHGKRHSGVFRLEWRWASEEYEAKWWDGTFFAQGFGPHDPRLLEYGGWYEVRGDESRLIKGKGRR